MSVAIFDAAGWTLALALCVPAVHGRPFRALVALAVVALLLHLPAAGVSTIALLRGAFGSPSVMTVVLLAAFFVARATGRRLFAPGEAVSTAALAAVTGVLFYPPALGLGPVDPYAWGYGGTGLVAVTALLTLLAGALGRWVLAAGLTLALAGWRMGLLESPNLWDYLIDPMLAIGGLIALVVLGVGRALRRPARA